MIRTSRWVGTVTLALLLAGTGAALTVARKAWWATGTVTYRGIQPGSEHADGVEWIRFRELGKVELPDPGWRPVRVSLHLAPPPGAPGTGAGLVISIDDEPVQESVIGPGPTSVTWVEHRSSRSRGLLGLQLTSQVFDEEGRGVAIAAASLEPVLTAGAVIRHAAPGAALGLVLWFLWRGPRPQRRAGRAAHGHARADAAGPVDRAPARRREILAVAAASFLLFLAWSVLKPPMQAPDEHFHFTRALAAPHLAWLGRSSDVPVTARQWNPLVAMPGRLVDLPFHGERRITREQLAQLKALSWPTEEGMRRQFTQAWGYPPAFYGATYAGGQWLTRLTGATPYASTYLYRAVVSAMAAACWAWVCAALRHTSLTRRQRWFTLGVCLASPMVPFLASSVNPDAVLVPLAILGIISGHDTLVGRRAHGLLFAVLLLAALVKPSALVLMAALCGTALLLALTRSVPWRDALDGLRPVVAAAIVSWLTLTMWVPLVLYGEARELNLVGYWGALQKYAWERWVSFWGRPGWLDYQGPDAFYVALLWVLALGVLTAAPRLARGWRLGEFAPFAVITSLLFIVGTLVGEFLYASRVGLTFQGRYVLPALVGVSAALLHAWRWARWAFIATLVALHVSLVERSISRYFGDASTWWASWPWTG